MRWTGQIFWLLAYGAGESFWLRIERISEAVTGRSQLSTLIFQLISAFLPPSPCFRHDWLMGSRIQLQQRNCSRVTRDFLRRSTFETHYDMGLQARKELLQN
jgi:hypothetical protein